MTRAREAPRESEPGSVHVDGIRFDRLTEQGSIARILEASRAGKGGYVVTPNLDHLRRARTDEAFRETLLSADLVVADGMPIVWASRILGARLPERVAGSNLVFSLSEGASREGRSVYLFGGDPGTAEKTAGVLRGKYPGLVVAGHYCPPRGFENDPAELDRIRDMLLGSRPDIVYVAVGSPKQEVFIFEHRRLLPSAWWIGVGVSFSFAAGALARAPVWMQRWGLEWVHRLAQEPRRLAPRYILHGLPFAVGFFSRALWRRLTVRTGSR